jgi:hypothetical protein
MDDIIAQKFRAKRRVPGNGRLKKGKKQDYSRKVNTTAYKEPKRQIKGPRRP